MWDFPLEFMLRKAMCYNEANAFGRIKYIVIQDNTLYF